MGFIVIRKAGRFETRTYDWLNFTVPFPFRVPGNKTNNLVSTYCERVPSVECVTAVS